ncbi:uncharacterized protein LOC126661588 [Mercurialis annua]|uniref:uncharacterized protein LOC126661588 n=1 Tax=Mercurialis annua TaxID=3986 RepID=UPI00215E77D9|nr:uncharacterized protein LOC126661588 [Mercurialis annua]
MSGNPSENTRRRENLWKNRDDEKFTEKCDGEKNTIKNSPEDVQVRDGNKRRSEKKKRKKKIDREKSEKKEKFDREERTRERENSGKTQFRGRLPLSGETFPRPYGETFSENVSSEERRKQGTSPRKNFKKN